MSQHEFTAPQHHAEFDRPIQTCLRCGVNKCQIEGVWHYYGREHMGEGHGSCPANFAACGTSRATSIPTRSIEAAGWTRAEFEARVSSLPGSPLSIKRVGNDYADMRTQLSWAWFQEAKKASLKAAELSAALGFPGGISDPTVSWPDLLRVAATYRLQATAMKPAWPDFKQLLEVFEGARAGSSRPVGMLRGILAVLADRMPAGGMPKPAAYAKPEDLISKRQGDEFSVYSSDPGTVETVPLYTGPARQMMSPPAEDLWHAMDNAPRSYVGEDGRIQAVYLLGYCPVREAVDLESCVCVFWWEPLMNKGQGMWYGEGGYELHPVKWMPLPRA